MIHFIRPNGKSEKLRWTDQHPSSHYGLGVLLRGHGGRILDGATFKSLALWCGAKIVCGDERERRRVAGALAYGALGLPDGKLEIQNQKKEKPKP